METVTLFDQEHYICTKEEGREVWKEKDKRPRIWMEDEARACFLMDNADLLAVVEMKRKKPGYTHKVQHG